MTKNLLPLSCLCLAIAACGNSDTSANAPIASANLPASAMPKFVTIKGFTLGDPLTVCPEGSKPHPDNKDDKIFGCYIEPTTFLGQMAYLRIHAAEDKRIREINIYINANDSSYPLDKLAEELIAAYGKPTTQTKHDGKPVIVWIDTDKGLATVAEETTFLGKPKLEVTAFRADTPEMKERMKKIASPKSDL